jgi:HK97 family phage prohead protease
MIDQKIEVRHITELRASTDPNSRKVAGTAIVFNSLSEDLGGFREVILPTAITQELINRCDIVMLYNHDSDQGVLARSKNGKGSLKITLTSTGVDFEFNAKKTSLGDEVLESVRQGDLTACSFAFRIAEGGDSWIKNIDGTYTRTISNIELLKDLSIVVDPAYAATSVDTRGLDELKSMEGMNDSTEPMDTPDATETNKEDINSCDMCDKCDLIIAQNQKIIEMIQGMIIEDVIEDLAETLEPVCVEPTEPEQEPIVEDSCDPTMEKREIDPDEELRKYYIELRSNIKSINI